MYLVTAYEAKLSVAHIVAMECWMDGWLVNNEWGRMWKEKVTDYCACLKKMKKTMKNFIHDRRAEGLHWTRDFTNAQWTATIDIICEVGLLSTSPHAFMVCCLIKHYASISSLHVQTVSQYTRGSRCVQSECAVSREPWSFISSPLNLAPNIRTLQSVTVHHTVGLFIYESESDRLCGLVVRVLGYRSGGPGSIPGTTRFSGKKK
jgi:hypothetical protein